MTNRKIEDILLYEVRENRKAIQAVETKLSKLDKDVFSNKIKLSIFIAGVTIFFNIIVVLLSDKIKTFFT